VGELNFEDLFNIKSIKNKIIWKNKKRRKGKIRTITTYRSKNQRKENKNIENKIKKEKQNELQKALDEKDKLMKIIIKE
jgi:hypothetical protein